MQKRKNEELKKQGVFNRQAKKVKAPLFKGDTFFDSYDLAQVKYEMVRQVTHEGKTITDSTDAFGLSRPTFYQAKEALDREGFLGLAPKKTGPKRRHKLNDEILNFIKGEIKLDEDISMQRLADKVREKYSIDIHPRSIERALVDQKKMSAPKQKI